MKINENEWNSIKFHKILKNVNAIQWNPMKLYEIQWNLIKFNEKQCKIVVGVEEIFNKHMISDNKRMKYNKTKGLTKEGVKMSPHVGRSKSSPPLAGSKKSVFDEQFVKNFKQTNHRSFWKNILPLNGAFNAITWNLKKFNEHQWNSMKFKQIQGHLIKFIENQWTTMKFNEIQWNCKGFQCDLMKSNKIVWNSMKILVKFNEKQCKIVVGVEEIYNKHMISDNKRMKYDKTKGLTKEGVKMSPLVFRV